MPTTLEADFHEAMLDIYRRAKSEANYNAVRYLQMVVERGGLAAAKALVEATHPSEAYTALWERGRLDLSVEALVLQKRWAPLFSDEDRALAGNRLKDYGFSPSEASAEPAKALPHSVPSSLLSRITFNPGQCGGRPCIRGMRIRVTDVLGLLSRGLRTEEALSEFPDLEREDILACLEYATTRLDHPRIVVSA
jgi:uncharacterized protein (DUF433 family)